MLLCLLAVVVVDVIIVVGRHLNIMENDVLMKESKIQNRAKAKAKVEAKKTPGCRL